MGKALVGSGVGLWSSQRLRYTRTAWGEEREPAQTDSPFGRLVRGCVVVLLIFGSVPSMIDGKSASHHLQVKSASMTANLILWTCSAPDPFAGRLRAAGYQVWEALALSEVTFLCETENIGVVVIKADVKPERVPEIEQHYVTMRAETRRPGE